MMGLATWEGCTTRTISMWGGSGTPLRSTTPRIEDARDSKMTPNRLFFELWEDRPKKRQTPLNSPVRSGGSLPPLQRSDHLPHLQILRRISQAQAALERARHLSEAKTSTPRAREAWKAVAKRCYVELIHLEGVSRRQQKQDRLVLRPFLPSFDPDVPPEL